MSGASVKSMATARRLARLAPPDRRLGRAMIAANLMVVGVGVMAVANAISLLMVRIDGKPMHLLKAVSFGVIVICLPILGVAAWRNWHIAVTEATRVAHERGVCPRCLYPQTREEGLMTCPECGLTEARVDRG